MSIDHRDIAYTIRREVNDAQIDDTFTEVDGNPCLLDAFPCFTLNRSAFQLLIYSDGYASTDGFLTIVGITITAKNFVIVPKYLVRKCP